MLMLNGTQLGGQAIRLSWGRSPSNKQPQPDPNQWNGGYYGYGQGYEAYGYAPPPQDPNMLMEHIQDIRTISNSSSITVMQRSCHQDCHHVYIHRRKDSIKTAIKEGDLFEINGRNSF